MSMKVFLFGPTKQNEKGQLSDIKVQRLPIRNGSVVYPDIPQMAMLFSQLEYVSDTPFTVEVLINKKNGRSVINVKYATTEDYLAGRDRKEYAIKMSALHGEQVHSQVQNTSATFAGEKCTWEEVPVLYNAKMQEIRNAIDVLEAAMSNGAPQAELEAGLAAIEHAQASIGVEYVE